MQSTTAQPTNTGARANFWLGNLQQFYRTEDGGTVIRPQLGFATSHATTSASTTLCAAAGTAHSKRREYSHGYIRARYTPQGFGAAQPNFCNTKSARESLSE